MIRQFYITIKAIEPLAYLEAEALIDILFPHSDVKEHLVGKYLSIKANYNNNPIMGIFNFYERLDSEHQLWFDTYLNRKIEEVNAKTIQY